MFECTFAKNQNQIRMETLKEAFYEKYPENHRILQYFEDANECECTWENLSKIRLQKYVNYMGDRIAPNSVKAYCSKLKAVLTAYNEEVALPKDYAKVLQIRTDASQHVYLNDDEIRMVMNYEPIKPAEKIVKNWFLIGCLTGARHSDYIRFTSKNIQENELHYVSIKTHTNTIVPLSSYVEKLIKENEEKEYNNWSCSDVYFNEVLKKLIRDTGIINEVSLYTKGEFKNGEKWTFVASHTARRSFATNLYRKGVDIYTISRLCGHSSVEMTKQYICCGPIISDSVLDYFNAFA